MSLSRPTPTSDFMDINSTCPPYPLPGPICMYVLYVIELTKYRIYWLEIKQIRTYITPLQNNKGLRRSSKI